MQKRAKIGFDYVHSLVDDHSRQAYSEILTDEKGLTCAGFLLRAAAYFADRGITRMERVMIDNHFSHKRSTAVRAAIADLGTKHKFIRPHLPPAERQSRTAKSNDSTEPCKPNGPTAINLVTEYD